METLTPLFEALHVSTIIDKLHIRCTDIVKSQNTLIQSEGGESESLDREMSRLQVMFSIPEVGGAARSLSRCDLIRRRVEVQCCIVGWFSASWNNNNNHCERQLTVQLKNWASHNKFSAITFQSIVLIYDIFKARSIPAT